MKLNLGLIIEDKAWREEDFISKNYIKNIVKDTLNHLEVFNSISEIELALLLTNDKKMQELNKSFLSKDKPTNVLSFPDVEIKNTELLEFTKSKDYIYLGDIAMGYNVIKLEATDANLTMRDHFTHLLVHGVLHLVGYDHIIPLEEEVMTRLEVDILKKYGISSPY
ncbi:MAG: hypothetical protein RLZZ59_699 [Pseudomonadota bacterium]